MAATEILFEVIIDLNAYMKGDDVDYPQMTST
jgi:hypothetical protein